ncbi:hypothetical protein ID866_3692 [Astraeus odoratus]|nr:hypothetical protein ID866_3692 [Astraeus odoratus]
MTNLLLIARCSLFALFVISNALICVSAVWNHSLTLSSQTLQVDVYLACLGVLGLMFAFILIFVELLIKHPFTTRVWFETGWVVTFWLMELGGATAVTVLAHTVQCTKQGVVSTDSLCTSERLLLSFTWICTTILLFYFILILYTTITYQRDNPDIWNSTVRCLHWAVGRESLRSPPNSPSTPYFKKHTETLPEVPYAPRPVRPIPRPVYIDHDRAGLGSEYEIEPYRSPPPAQRMPVSEQIDVEYRNSLPEAIPIPLSEQARPLTSRPPPASPTPPPAAFLRPSEVSYHPIYGPFPTQRELPSTIIYTNQEEASRAEHLAPSPQSHPLGDWPRRDIMNQPVKRKRRTEDSQASSLGSGLPSSRTVTQRSQSLVAGAELVGAGHPFAHPSLFQSRARRPSGPRLLIPSDNPRVTP